MLFICSRHRAGTRVAHSICKWKTCHRARMRHHCASVSIWMHLCTIALGELTSYNTVNQPPLIMCLVFFNFRRQMYGRTVSTRDVPGITRSALRILKQHNISAISVGQNPGTPPANVPMPGAFVWRDPETDSEVMAIWHGGGYPGNPVCWFEGG